jgi:hypothetical protein
VIYGGDYGLTKDGMPVSPGLFSPYTIATCELAAAFLVRPSSSIESTALPPTEKSESS